MGRSENLHSRLPAQAGIYALILFCPRGEDLEVGALGRRRFPAGWYVYVGSAWGPGGLRGRLGRHLAAGGTLRWHIDFLRRAAALREIWCLPGAGAATEHRWADLLAQAPGASVPVPRFGAGDCRCRAHLLAFAEKPSARRFAAGLGRRSAGGARLLAFRLRPGEELAKRS
ncbi:MAG: GIY-YIG nuclease family protein [Desulfobacterales bacterium]